MWNKLCTDETKCKADVFALLYFLGCCLKDYKWCEDNSYPLRSEVTH